MKFFKKISIISYLWASILLLALFLRIYGLGLNPVGVSHDDELHEIINAKSLALTGEQAPGRIAGIFTRNDDCTGNCVYGELGTFLLAPWMFFFPLSLFWSKIPFALCGVGIVYFAGKFFENLFNNKKIGLLAGLMVAINPWAIHFGRMAYLTIFGNLFILWALYHFTKRDSIKKNLLLGSTLAFIATLFYFGTKPLFIPLVLWAAFYNFLINRFRNYKFLTVLVIGALLINILYLFVLYNSPAGRRLGDLAISENSEIQKLVNQERSTSLEIPYLRDLTINKYIITSRVFTEKFLGVFNPDYLFLTGARGGPENYLISNHAYNYLIDFPLLFLGIAALAYNYNLVILLLALICIVVFPAALRGVGENIYSFRAALLFPLISGLAASGAFWLYQKIQVTLVKQTFLVILLTIYSISLFYFHVMYWHRTPFEKNEGAYFYKRALVKYLTLPKDSNNHIAVLTSQPPDTFNTYLFYSGIYNNSNSIRQINQNLKAKEYSINNIDFLSTCENLRRNEKNYQQIITEQGIDCEINTNNKIYISNTKDAGSKYTIYHDSMCAPYNLNRYPYPRKISEFNIENMDSATFCKTWINKP